MSAVISECGLYRYRLDRDVQMDGIVAALIGVNPSTADAVGNDPTIRKDIGFAKVNGWRRFIKGNVFGYRSKDVKDLATALDPIGQDNHRYLREIAAEADILIPCWGRRSKTPKHLRHHLDETLELLLATGKPVMTFGYTKCGEPLHPLMLAYSTPLVAHKPAATLPVVVRWIPQFGRWYLCHAESYQNAFPSSVNGFYTRGEACTFAKNNGCRVEKHAHDQLQNY